MTREKVYSSDEHYYMPPAWFLSNENRFDEFDRSKPLIFAGEYAAHDTGRKNTLYSALSEAVFLNGIECNADIVDMTCYAPLFGRDGHSQWNPDLIYFNKRDVVRTTNYYVQQLYGQNKGDVYLRNRVTMKPSSTLPTISGHIGVGTWNTTIEVDHIEVNGRELKLADWKIISGDYAVQEGHYIQSNRDAQPAMSISQKAFQDETLLITMRARKTDGAEGFLVQFGADEDGNGGYWWNVGGWNNNRHGLQKLTGGSAPIERVDGSITTNRWYDLKVELTPGKIRCYIDNQLVHDYQVEQGALSLSSTYHRQAGEVILKLVNPTASPFKASISLAGTRSVASMAKLISLSGDKDATNTFEQPANVVPLESSISVGTEFTHTVPAFAVEFIRLRAEL